MAPTPKEHNKQYKSSKSASPKKHPININLFTEDYEELKALAKQDQRSITNYVTVILLKHIYAKAAQQAKPPTT